MATVTITGATVRDVTGTPDNRPWYLAAVTYQDGHDGGVVTPKKSQALLPVAGVLSFEAESGVTVRIQNPDGDSWYVIIPDSDADLWVLIAAAVAFPPGTSAQAVGTAVDSYLDANPVLPDRLRFEGDYSGSGDYMVNDVVRYTDPAPSPTTDLTGLYACITDHTVGSPKDFPSRWRLVAAGSWAGLSGKPAVPLCLDVADSPYGITSDSLNPEVGIQQAIDDASANGIPEVVVSRPGTYTVGLHVIPGQTAYAAALWGRSNVKLTLKPGVVIKLKNNATLPAGCTQGQLVSMVSPGTVKTGWCIEGGIIDGNAANQTSLAITHGIYFERVQSGYVKDVLVKNIYGTASAPPGETYHFEANKCANVRFINCEADGSGNANTATGFSTDDSFGVAWIGCSAHDMGFGMGFTCWQSSGLRYSGCFSYRNVMAGFNAERSEGIAYSSCIAGGRSPYLASGTNPLFPSGQTAVGNGTGFNIHGCTDVVGMGCVSTYNATGLHIYTNIGISPSLVCTRVLFTGCDFRQNTSMNVTVERASDGGSAQDQVEVQIWNCFGGSTAGGGITDAIYNFGNAPIQFYDCNSQSGVRYSQAGQGTYAYRWQAGQATSPPIAGNASLALTSLGQLMTAGLRKNRHATAADLTAIPVDEVIAVTDTSAVRTIALPSAATVGAGATLLVVDESGGAATHNIIVARAGSDLIDGVTSKRIVTNYGMLWLMSTGTGWHVLSQSAGPGNVGINWYPGAVYQSGNYYVCNSTASVNTSNTLGNGSLRVSKWVVTDPLPLAKLWAEITGAGDAGSTFRIGIYADDGTGKPGALVLDAGTIAADSATVQEVTVSITLQPGLYWVGGAVQGVATTQPTVRTMNPLAADNLISYGTSLPSAGATRTSWLMGSVTGALPSTFTPSASGTAPARIGFKVA